MTADARALDQARVRSSFAAGRRLQVAVKKLTAADRAARCAAHRAEQAKRDASRAADVADREAGLYVPTPLEKDFLEEMGLSPSEVAQKRFPADPQDPASADRLQQHVAELKAYVERRRSEGTGQE